MSVHTSSLSNYRKEISTGDAHACFPCGVEEGMPFVLNGSDTEGGV